jgi:phosphoserine phosphatase
VEALPAAPSAPATTSSAAPQQLVRLAGSDRPGITSAVLAALDEAGVTLLEMDQIVVRGNLTLDLLVAAPGGIALEPILGPLAQQLAVRLGIEPAPDSARATPLGSRAVVTVIAPRLGAGALAAVTGAIATSGANIDRIMRLAHRPVCAFEFRVVGGDPATLRSVLVDAAAEHGVDVAVQPERLERRAKRLVVLDVDSTLIRDEVIELIAAEVGCEAEVASITARAMAGELDFEASLRARVALLAGAGTDALDAAAARVRLTPGARTLVATLRRLGFIVAIVSGGFHHVVDRLAADLGIDHAVANTLEVVDGRLTGGLVGPVLDRAGKARELERIAALERIPLEQTIAIGDGANDLDMIAVAGLGVAFNAKPAVRAAADTAVNVPRLDAILFLLGIHGDDIDLDPDDVDADDAAALSAVVAGAPGAGCTEG